MAHCAQHGRDLLDLLLSAQEPFHSWAGVYQHPLQLELLDGFMRERQYLLAVKLIDREIAGHTTEECLLVPDLCAAPIFDEPRVRLLYQIFSVLERSTSPQARSDETRVRAGGAPHCEAI